MLGFCLPPPAFLREVDDPYFLPPSAFLRQVDDPYEVNIGRRNFLQSLCSSYNSVIYENKCQLKGKVFMCGNILTYSYITHLS